MQAAFGIVVLLGLAWLLSENRRRVHVRLILVGLFLQFVLAGVLLRFEPMRDALLIANYAISGIERATTAGTSFVFGFLGGGETPYEVTRENATYLFAFRVLPQILVFSVLVAIGWYWRILPAVIHAFAWALRRALGVGGSVGVAVAADVFLGMVETPLVIRAYLKHLTRSEFFVVMTCGMSTVAGSIMVLYASILERNVVHGALGHILIASIVNVFGAVVIARTMVPSTESVTEGGDVEDVLQYSSLMDAIMRGTSDGLRLVVNIGAMLIVLVSLIALVNAGLNTVEVAGNPLALERIMGWLFAPVAWLMGVPWHEAVTSGSILGTKLVLNELVAYIQLAGLPLNTLSESSRLILTYALCGFANFGSLGIMLGGLIALVPERRNELLVLAPKTVLSATLVNCLTGAIVGLVLAPG